MSGIEIIGTDAFKDWLSNLRDSRAQKSIAARVRRFELGLFGDVKPVGEGVYEARIDYGGGYRLYYARAGVMIIIMLCGGDKGSQKRDIAKAKEMKKEFEIWPLS